MTQRFFFLLSCPFCSSPVKENHKFCSQCGSRLPSQNFRDVECCGVVYRVSGAKKSHCMFCGSLLSLANVNHEGSSLGVRVES